MPLDGKRTGEDVILADVLAFDLKVYDPLAEVRSDGDPVSPTALAPSDTGWKAATIVLGTGEFVDLNYAPGLPNPSHFSGPPGTIGQAAALANSNYSNDYASYVYDTWTSFYERDGLDQNNDGAADEGADGLDNDDKFGADDAGEREAPPPYAFPLRGIQLTVRVMEVSTRQVMQSSAVIEFPAD